MTYVLDQTGAELREHMRRITDTSGWDDPLATRLWAEVQALDSRLADAEREVTGMMWQRIRAEERAEDAERRLAASDQPPSIGDCGLAVVAVLQSFARTIHAHPQPTPPTVESFEPWHQALNAAAKEVLVLFRRFSAPPLDEKREQ